MFCPNCGNELKEDEVFCPKCGTKVTENEPSDTAKEDSMSDLGQEPVVIPGKSSSGNALTIVLLSVVGVAVLVVLVVAGFFIVPKVLDDGSKQLVYMDDGDIYYLKNMNEPDKAILVDDTDYSYLDAWFSEDGKYLYYYSRKKNKTLSRIPVSKIKANSKNSGKYIEKLGNEMALRA